MVTSALPAVGVQINGHELIELLGESRNAWIWLGCTPQKKSYRVFKIAKPPDAVLQSEIEESADPFGFLSQALIPVTGNLLPAAPDKREMLANEFRFLQAAHGVGIVGVHELHEWNGLLCMEMEYLPNTTTLRQLLNLGRATLDHVSHLLFITDWIQRLRLSHGDLKPENVLVGDNQLWLIDAGFFGEMKTESGVEEEVIFTTTIYYPRLQPNDLWAVGAILWEVVTGQHPLHQGHSEPSMTIGKDLSYLLRAMEATGRHYFSPIRNLRLPFEPDASDAERRNEILLTAIGLKHKNGVLELRKEPIDGLQMQEALGRLRKMS